MKFPLYSFMAIFDVSTFFTLANQEAVVNGRQPYRYVIVGKPILEKECVKQRPISTTFTADFISLYKLITVKKQGNKNFTWLILTLFTGQYWTLIDTRQLWEKIPDIYRQHATFYTDLYDSYVDVIPEKQHVRVTKNTGLTNPIERFNCTMRQRFSRLVRDSLAFSKKLDHHIGAIRYFIYHYNQTKNPTALLV